MPKAFITGITGQDGSYLTDLLLSKGYEVHGLMRRSSTFNTSRLNHVYQDPHDENRKLFLHYGDLTDASCLLDIVLSVQPDEIYNLGAQSHVRVSFDCPVYSVDTVALGTLRMLEAARQLNKTKAVKFYQAASSEMFGNVAVKRMDETTKFCPRSPYGCAKVYAYHQTVNYREAYGLFACNGILFNHESPRRGETFVTRKITRGVTRIRQGLQKKLHLGNLSARRDWGHAKDYVVAMWLMLQHDRPEDFVIATGESHSVQDFLNEACSVVDLKPEEIVEIDQRYMRPAEVDTLLGDASKAHQLLGWQPTFSFGGLVLNMTNADWELARREAESCPATP